MEVGTKKAGKKSPVWEGVGPPMHNNTCEKRDAFAARDLAQLCTGASRKVRAPPGSTAQKSTTSPQSSSPLDDADEVSGSGWVGADEERSTHIARPRRTAFHSHLSVGASVQVAPLVLGPWALVTPSSTLGGRGAGVCSNIG
jgi:hypothetical protein